MVAIMGAWMMIWMVVGIVLFVTVLALGVGAMQRMAGSVPASRSEPQAVDDPAVADSMRASDADRNYAVAILQEGTTAGRLTTGEFDDRMRSVYAGRTIGDLRELLTDLPRTR